MRKSLKDAKRWFRKNKSKLKLKLKLLGEQTLKVTFVTLLALSTAYSALNLSQFHRDFLRLWVGSNVVQIVRLNERGVIGGGTGFIVNAPSGKQYILTNAHVCEHLHSENATIIMPNGNYASRKVLQISDKTDLCLIEGLPGFRGLNIASSSRIGQNVYSVGHPQLGPLTVVDGEIRGADYILTMLGTIGKDYNEADCHKRRNTIRHEKTDTEEYDVCADIIFAQDTTLTIVGGNSGSPAVNVWGQVIGVVFASDDETIWGDIISLADINEFLAPY